MGSRVRLFALAALVLALLAVATPADAGKGGNGKGSGGGGGGGGEVADPWADWVPPAHWTAEQQAYARQLIDDALANEARWASTAQAAADGYVSIGDGKFTVFDHWINGALFDDGRFPDATAPESLMYRKQKGKEKWNLASFMYMLPSGTTMDDIPPELAWIPGWHTHELCFRSDGTLGGVPDANGNCPAGTFFVATQPMFHVWVDDNECHDPFAGIETGGPNCDGHMH